MKNLGPRASVTLGNHDLHLLAVAAGAGKPHKRDTISDILAAPDRDELIDWLRRQPLLIEEAGVVFVHAGIHPLWPIERARMLSAEAAAALSGPDWAAWLQGMYGNSHWEEGIEGPARMRAILNAFTRMRFVDRDTGELDFEQKEGVADAPRGFSRGSSSRRGSAGTSRSASDTGRCWGSSTAPTSSRSTRGASGAGKLTAVRFPDRRFFEEPCPCWADPFAFKKK